jgi:predicted small secreted protein
MPRTAICGNYSARSPDYPRAARSAVGPIARPWSTANDPPAAGAPPLSVRWRTDPIVTIAHPARWPDRERECVADASVRRVKKQFLNQQQGNTMIARFVMMLAALAVASISLTACNTMQGAGKDVEKVGTKVQDEAQEHKKY